MSLKKRGVSDYVEEGLRRICHAAFDVSPVTGLTHRFYRYPARFSPAFAAAVINSFSEPGQLVLDPYMGGGTTVVEALASGRRVVGCDLNSLAVFIGKVKTTILSENDREAVLFWANDIVPTLLYSSVPTGLPDVICKRRTRNLSIPFSRPIKKMVALALLSLRDLPSKNAEDFARCAILNVGQLALNGRTCPTSASEFRKRLTITTREMLEGLADFERKVQTNPKLIKAVLINDTATNLMMYEPLSSEKADLAVSSPPYPGIHILYHRWQVDGRRETPAPYWIAACQDGQGAAFYNFADRRRATDAYFPESLRTLKGIRMALKDGAMFVQLVAFGNPEEQLPLYLQNMTEAGFQQIHTADRQPIWRTVPGRRWHATIKGSLSGSREIVLLHQAV